MKMVVFSLAFCGRALCQTAPDHPFSIEDLLKYSRPNLTVPVTLPPTTMAALAATAAKQAPRACAVPLLNALPAKASEDAKIRVYQPAASGDRMPSAAGLPACK